MDEVVQFWNDGMVWIEFSELCEIFFNHNLKISWYIMLYQWSEHEFHEVYRAEFEENVKLCFLSSRLGLLVCYWTMRFEAKHQYF